MAGRGQHFIPRHFQKPFAIPGTKDQIFMYRRGRGEEIILSIGDSGKEHDFYSSPSLDGQPTLDDLITEYEKKIFPIVDALRKQPVGSVVLAESAAEITVHFFIRAQHLRKSVSEVWERLTDLIFSIAADPRSVAGARRLPAHRPPVPIRSAIEEQIISHKLGEITGVSPDALVRLFYMGLREQLEQLTGQAREAIAAVAKQFGVEARDRIREAHRDILRSSMAPPKRVAELQGLTWAIVEHTDSSAIIPDCVCIAADALGAWQPLLLADQLALVVMPLTPHTLLVGRRSSGVLFDASEFNSLAAKACFDFFLSKEKLHLRDLLAGDVGEIIRDDIAAMVTTQVIECLDVYLTAPVSDQASELNNLSREGAETEEHSFSVCLHDFGDSSYAQNVSENILEIVRQSQLGQCCSTLDGFTFADDYTEALNSLDRGYVPTAVLKPEESEFGVGVAMPLTVRRGDELKTHFVLRGFLANLLLSHDESERSAAHAMVRNLLAGLFLDHLERTRFAGWALQEIAAPIENCLYPHSRGIFDTYFKARHAGSSEEEVVGQLEALQEHMPAIVSSCVDRRRAYRFDGDLDGLLAYVFEKTSLVLKRVAHLLGGAASLWGGDCIPVQMRVLMSRLSMDDWLVLFADDLSKFYESLERWHDFEEIFFTNRHFERWLVFLGVIIEERDGSELYAHVPEGIDAEFLSQFATPA